MSTQQPIAALRRHASGLLAVRLVAAGSQAVFLAVLARALDVPEFVAFAAAVGVGTFVAIAADLGVTPALTRMRAANPRDPRIRGMLKILIATTLLTMAISVVLVPLLVHRMTFWATIFIAIWSGLERFGEAGSSVLVADVRTRLLMLTTILRRFVPVVVLGLWLLGADLTLDEAVVCVTVANAIGAVVIAVVLLNVDRGLAEGDTNVREQMRESFPFWINSVGVQLRQLDIVVVSWVTTVAQTASYSVVSRLITPLRLIPTSFASAVLPFVARSKGAGASDVLRGLKQVMVVTTGLYVLVGIFAEPIIRILFGDDYLSAVTPLRISLVGLTIAGVVSALNAMLLATHDEVYAAINSMVCGILGLGFLAGGAALWGANGAAAALSLSFGVQVIPLALRTRQHQRAPLPTVESIDV